MVKLASKETGLNIQNICFQEMDFDQEFDGVWAQASLLHIPYDETRSVYEKIHRSLKPEGIFYATYKYGQNYMPTEERDFWNMDEQTIQPYLEGLFDVIALLKVEDNRVKTDSNKDQAFQNVIGRKI
jgi:SAM-dependent methyltransferase